MKKLLLISAISLMATGCAQQTFVMSDQEGELTSKQSQHFFLEGIGQKKEVDAAAVCGDADSVAKVEVEETFVNGLLGVVTFGIYTPREARIYCAAAKQQ